MKLVPFAFYIQNLDRHRHFGRFPFAWRFWCAKLLSALLLFVYRWIKSAVEFLRAASLTVTRFCWGAWIGLVDWVDKSENFHLSLTNERIRNYWRGQSSPTYGDLNGHPECSK